MRLKQLTIYNYRNLSGKMFKFNHDINFIIGENNIGKTNVLDLLNIIFNRREFEEEDFFDKDEPLEVKAKLKIEDGEIGIFDDYFAFGEDKTIINILIKQETIEDNIKYYEERTGDEIYRTAIKSSHFISYGSVRNPNKELNFNGKNNFLNELMKKVLVQQENFEVLNEDAVDQLLYSINYYIHKLDTFNLFNITAGTGESINNMLGRLIQLLAEEKYELNELGEGTQFLNSIPLVLLNQISNIFNNKKQNAIIEVEGRKTLNVIISIDEPELHLHPHSQRYFIHYIKSILNNEDKNFNELLNFLFGIDAIQGQLFIITHSPFILDNDYKQIIRVYRNLSEEVLVKNGLDIDIGKSLEKHLYRFFNELKEAFYAKKVLVVEGETEIGAVNPLFEREGINPNKEGISVLNSHGVERVPQLMKLFENFGVKVVGIIDKDNGNIDNEPRYQGIKGLFQTTLTEFEDDIVECYNFDKYIDFYEAKDVCLISRVMGVAKKFNIDLNPTTSSDFIEQLRRLEDEKKNLIFAEVKENFIRDLKSDGNKGVVNGMLVAEHALVTPDCFKAAFQDLVKSDE
ncbi:ATP-dependent nuclease [Lentibacillus sp. JNUCC-1]|uniref:ATP-dependent nuclease n=1 Tax=Lentibacillus sp. JNUCC-1 TaxID=2654513 RepID=UPI002F906B80